MRLTWSLGIAALVLAACSTQEAGNGSWTPLATPTSSVDDSRSCVRAQRREARVAGYQLQRLVLRVLREEEPQPENAYRVRTIVHSLQRSVAPRCGERTALDPLVEVVDTRVGDARGALDEPTLRLVVDTFRNWAGEVDAAGSATLYYHRNPCVPFRRGVDVSVEVVRADPAVARVVLVVDNRLPERIYVDHGGRIRVDGLAPEGSTTLLDWGGSSSDTAAVFPGRTVRDAVWPAGLRDQDISLLPGASLEVHDAYASAYSKITCQVPVRLPE